MTKFTEAVKDRDNAWKQYYDMEQKRDAVLAAVRSVFGLEDAYADKVVEGFVQQNGPYRVVDGTRRVSGLRSLESDLLAASESTKATDALARLTKRQTGSSTVVNVTGGAAPSKRAVKKAVRRTPGAGAA